VECKVVLHSARPVLLKYLNLTDLQFFLPVLIHLLYNFRIRWLNRSEPCWLVTKRQEQLCAELSYFLQCDSKLNSAGVFKAKLVLLLAQGVFGHFLEI
jgi:hypothetical protein